jgi:hypothetical protein
MRCEKSGSSTAEVFADPDIERPALAGRFHTGLTMPNRTDGRQEPTNGAFSVRRLGSPFARRRQSKELSETLRLSRMLTRRLMTADYGEMNRYFEMVHRRLPDRVSRFIRWLRKPSSKAARLTVALLLILGGLFSFLPVLGIWMLPLGLLFIAQDVPFLRGPLVKVLAWSEIRWEQD